jgi:hypothetical protein
MTTFLLSGSIEHASGYVASALVLATFCMGTMLGLRMTAIASNVAIIFYAATTDIRPVLILHSILLPVNVVRLVQIELAHRTEAPPTPTEVHDVVLVQGNRQQSPAGTPQHARCNLRLVTRRTRPEEREHTISNLVARTHHGN